MRKIFLFFILVTFSFLCLSEERGNILFDKFKEKWEHYFGKFPEHTLNLDDSLSKESKFERIWEVYSNYIPVEERTSAYETFRFHLLNDKRPIYRALSECLNSSTLLPQKGGEVLYYLFLEEEIQEPSIISMALPPSENGKKVFEALNNFGENQDEIRKRIAIFIIKHLINYRLIPEVKDYLPLILSTSKELRASEFLYVNFQLSHEFLGIKCEISGSNIENINVVGVYLDENRKIKRIITSKASLSPLFPSDKNGSLIIFFFNPSEKETSDITGATFYKIFSPPIQILNILRKEDTVILKVDESDSIFGYLLEGKNYKSNFLRANGEGINEYIFFVDKDEKELFLKVYTGGGLLFKVKIP